MKKIIVITGILLLAFSGVKAQQLINGEKAPELKLSEWISKNQLQSGKPTLIEFFVSRSDLSMKRLPTVDDFARNYGKKLNVVVIGCETKDKIQSVMDGKGYAVAVAVDNEHKTFTAYGAQFVPYGVLLDARGKVLWFGNSSKFGAEELKKTLEWE